MNPYHLFLTLALVCVVGCRTRGPGFDAHKPATFQSVAITNQINSAWLQPSVEPYRLGPGDVIDIETIGDVHPKAMVSIGPDGKFYYSLLPGISAWGLTLAQTRELLQKELSKFVRGEPEISVTLRTVASKYVSIVGSVSAPGLFPLATPTTLLEALALAGGIPVSGGEDAADLSRSFVLREGHAIPVNMELLLKRGDLRQNIYLQPGDLVVIRPADIPSVYVLGAVATPNILPYSRNRSLATTIISCGGMLKYAQKSQVAIVRGGLTQPQIATLDYQAIVKGDAPDVLLQPGDIVYVPFSPFRQVYQLAESILDQFVRTVAVNEGQAIGSPRSQPVGVSSPFGFTPIP